MSARNRFFILLSIIFVIAATYYFFSADHSQDLVLIGTVDSNQVIVSAQVEGRIQKLLVEEGTPVKAGDLIAVLDPSELQTQEAAASATIASLQHKVSEMQHTERSTSGSTSSDVANAQAKVSSAKAQLMQAKATLDRTESDSRRSVELAKAGVAYSDIKPVYLAPSDARGNLGLKRRRTEGKPVFLDLVDQQPLFFRTEPHQPIQRLFLRTLPGRDDHVDRQPVPEKVGRKHDHVGFVRAHPFGKRT